jgi:hypothetical protein
MKRFIIQYRVKPGRAEENETLVRAVFEELKRAAPKDTRYTCLKMDDGLSFAHIVETPDGANAISTLEAFKKFSAGIRDRLEAEPVQRHFSVVGAYGFFEG